MSCSGADGLVEPHRCLLVLNDDHQRCNHRCRNRNHTTRSEKWQVSAPEPGLRVCVLCVRVYGTWSRWKIVKQLLSKANTAAESNQTDVSSGYFSSLISRFLNYFFVFPSRPNLLWFCCLSVLVCIHVYE